MKLETVDCREIDIGDDIVEPCAALPRNSLVNIKIECKKINHGFIADSQKAGNSYTNPLNTISKINSLIVKIKSEMPLLHKLKSKIREDTKIPEKWKMYDQKFNTLMEELQSAYEGMKKNYS